MTNKTAHGADFYCNLPRQRGLMPEDPRGLQLRILAIRRWWKTRAGEMRAWIAVTSQPL